MRREALHVGQHIDASFTRSFYTRMMGQPLTYQVSDDPFHQACSLTCMRSADVVLLLALP